MTLPIWRRTHVGWPVWRIKSKRSFWNSDVVQWKCDGNQVISNWINSKQFINIGQCRNVPQTCSTWYRRRKCKSTIFWWLYENALILVSISRYDKWGPFWNSLWLRRDNIQWSKMGRNDFRPWNLSPVSSRRRNWRRLVLEFKLEDFLKIGCRLFFVKISWRGFDQCIWLSTGNWRWTGIHIGNTNFSSLRRGSPFFLFEPSILKGNHMNLWKMFIWRELIWKLPKPLDLL